jgi:hypothetical protein
MPTSDQSEKSGGADQSALLKSRHVAQVTPLSQLGFIAGVPHL